MSLEYSDDNELIYQAKAVAKDIVNAKYEVTKKVGSFLFLAHSEEEFYQRATAIDEILESTSSRRLASVSDSKAKLVKALHQEWELKHASCKQCIASYPTCSKDGCNNVREDNGTGKCKSCNDKDYNTPNEVKKTSSTNSSSEINFNLPERVASPVTPMNEGNKKLWDKWSWLSPSEDGKGLKRRTLFAGDMLKERFTGGNRNGQLKWTPNAIKAAKGGMIDQAIGGSLGRLDDPEINKQVVPGSAVWIDPHGVYGPDKKRRDSSLKPGKGQGENSTPLVDESKLSPMMGIITGRRSLGRDGVLTSYHKCTGNSFRGFNDQTNSFPACSHVHHEGDGCGLTSETAADGSTQPGCGQHHAIVKVLTPSFYSEKLGDGSSRTGALPHIEGEQPKDLSGLSPSERQQTIERLRDSGTTPDDVTNPSEEQVGEIPWSRMFLMHPDQSEKIAKAHDEIHAKTGGEGRHPANLDVFKIGDKIHKVGDIVSTKRRWGSGEPRVEDNLAMVVGASSNRNGEHVRLGRSVGLAPNTGGESSMVDSTPGEYSLMLHRIHDPITGKGNSTVVDPETNRIRPEKNINETTLYYPSSNVETIESPSPKKENTTSKLYSTLKRVQGAFKAKPTPARTERPRTVSPSRGSLDYSDLDLNSLFD